MQEMYRDLGLILGLGRSPGGGHSNLVQYSCLENSMDRGTRRATVHGAAKSQTWLKWQHTHTAQCQLFWLFQLLFICYQDGSLQLCSDLCWDSVTRQRGEECRLSSPSWGILRFWDSVTSSFKKNFIYLTVQGLSCHTWDLYSLLHHSGSFSCSTWNLF